MTTCQSPLLAKDAAVLRPRPEEAPVMITVGFWEALSELTMAEGRPAATGAAAMAEARTGEGLTVEGEEARVMEIFFKEVVLRPSWLGREDTVLVVTFLGMVMLERDIYELGKDDL